MEPWFSCNDKNMFYRYLDNCSNYFEFGSGGSTYQASQRINIKKIHSVESDNTWHLKLKNMLKDKNNINFIYNEMKTKPKTWGNPGKNSTKEERKSYSDQICNLSEEDAKNIDLVLIDGRFRVACCFKTFNQTKKDCLVIFDDYLNRKFYHVVEKYYDIIDKTEDKRMVVLKKKEDIAKVKIEDILKYEDDKR